MKRRSFIKGLIGAVASPAVITETAQEQIGIGPLEGSKGVLVEDSFDPLYNEAIRSGLDPKLLTEAIWKIGALLHDYGTQDQKAQFFASNQIKRIDADVFEYCSFSLSAKIRAQKERDCKRHVDAHRDAASIVKGMIE